MLKILLTYLQASLSPNIKSQCVFASIFLSHIETYCRRIRTIHDMVRKGVSPCIQKTSALLQHIPSTWEDFKDHRSTAGIPHMSVVTESIASIATGPNWRLHMLQYLMWGEFELPNCFFFHIGSHNERTIKGFSDLPRLCFQQKIGCFSLDTRPIFNWISRDDGCYTLFQVYMLN